jgi:hypothetical protein
MTGHVELEGIGKATTCELYKAHRPIPLRFVWHHVLPETCGGLTQTGNLASLCDSCHYSVHILLYQLAHPDPAHVVKGTKTQQALAQKGYDQAVAAGTADKIPKEA